MGQATAQTQVEKASTGIFYFACLSRAELPFIFLAGDGGPQVASTHHAHTTSYCMWEFIKIRSRTKPHFNGGSSVIEVVKFM